MGMKKLILFQSFNPGPAGGGQPFKVWRGELVRPSNSSMAAFGFHQIIKFSSRGDRKGRLVAVTETRQALTQPGVQNAT